MESSCKLTTYRGSVVYSTRKLRKWGHVLFSLRECKLPTLLIDSTGRPLRKGGCFTKPTSNAFHETTQSMTTCALTSVRTTIYDNAFYSSMILSFAARFHCLLSHLSPVESSRCRIPSCNFISFFREKTVPLFPILSRSYFAWKLRNPTVIAIHRHDNNFQA